MALERAFGVGLLGAGGRPGAIGAGAPDLITYRVHLREPAVQALHVNAVLGQPLLQAFSPQAFLSPDGHKPGAQIRGSIQRVKDLICSRSTRARMSLARRRVSIPPQSSGASAVMAVDSGF